MRGFLLIMLLLWASPSFTQTPASSTPNYGDLSGKPLVEGLVWLDENYNFRFSYNPAALEGITIPKFEKPVEGLEEFLSLCLKDQKLQFEKISDTYVIFPTDDNTPEANIPIESISGVVRDKSTREALPYATVSVIETRLSTITNSDGLFALFDIPSDSLFLEIRYVGYKPFRINLKGVNPDNLMVCELEISQRNLPSIEVLARPENLLEIDPVPSQLTFNPAQISNLPSLGENDLFSALRRIPGISGASDAESGLKIRGGNSDQNLVLFDGITIYHVDHFFGFLSAFNSNIVKNVQVMKGGFGAEYGGRSSGVINITGIDGNKLKPSLILEANLLSANILAQIPIVPEKASLTIGYRRAYTDIIQTGAYKKMFNNSFNSSRPNSDGSSDVFDGENNPDYKYYDFNAKFHFKPTDRDAISLSYYQGEDDLNINFLGTFEELKRESNDQTTWGNRGGSIKWSKTWNKNWFSYFNFGISNYKSLLTSDESFYLNQSDTLLSEAFFDQRVTVQDRTLRFDNKYELNPNTKLDFGYWYTKNKISLQAQNQNFILQDSTQEGVQHAGYASVTQTINRLDITFGLRGTYYDLSDAFYLDPRASFTFEIDKHLSLKGAYGIYHQMIRRLNERSLYLSVPETWTLASPTTVPVLQNHHYILGGTYRSSGWLFDAETYYKTETGTVTYLYPQFGNPTGNLDFFATDGNRNIFGVDVMIKRNIKRHSIILGYTYLNSQTLHDDVNEGEYFNSPGIANHEIDLTYHYEINRWDFSAGFVFATGLPYTPVLGTFVVTLPSGEQQQFVSFGELNSVALEPYHRLDVEATYTMPIKNGSLQVGVSLYNVYNQTSVKFIDYYEVPEENSTLYTLQKNNVYTLGFTPSVFLKLRL